MYASNYLEELILNLLRGSSHSINIPGLYVALFLSNPTDTGSAGTEISYSGYARQTIAFTTPAASGGGLEMHNSAEITFPECSSGSNTVTYVGIFDSLSGGNMLLYGELSSSLIVQPGVSPVFRAGSLKWTWTGNLSTYYRTRIMNAVRRNLTATGFTPKIALCNGDPTGTGSEFSGNNYSRISVSFTAPAQQTSGVAQTQNSAEIVSAVSSGSWGNLTHLAIYDAASNGNCFAVIALSNTYTINTNSSVGFRAGALKFSIN